MHERTFLMIGAAAAILLLAMGLLARSRAIHWQRFFGDLLPGWPWW